MKKRLHLARAAFTLLAMLCFSMGVRAQSELTIYEDATGNSSYVPVYGLWADAYLKCEFVVPADELAAMNGGTISQMTFYLKQSAEVAWTGTFQVFLKEVEDATISAFSGTDDATIVYEGTLDATGSTMSINFSENYTYGGGNLLVGIYQIVKGNYKSATFYGETVTGACVSGYNSNSLDMSATQRNFIPKTTFTYSGGGAMVFSKPKNLVVDLSDDTAVLSWTAPNNDVTGYAYQYKKAGDENWSQEETVNETTVTLSGLSLATPYEFQVKALYDGGESGYVTISFFTDCGAYSLPFTYGFEDADELKCWTLDYTANTPGIVADPTHTGSKSFRFSSYSTASSYDQYLISPKLDTTKGVDVEFYYRSYGSGNGEKFKVGYSTTTNDPSEFTWGDEITTNTTEWTLFEGSFPAGTKYVAIYYCTNYQYYLYIDDFSISEASDYPKPTGLTVNYTGDDVAEVSWTGEATSFDIDVNGTITEGVTSPYTLNDLALGTTYEVKVRANYGNGNYSEWTVPVSFTTNECMDEDMCYITYEIKAKPYQGSYQYGWYYSYLLVYNNVNGDDSDEMIDAWTVPQNDEDGIVTGALQVCPGQNIRFEWYSQYSYDNLFIGDIIVKDANGEDIINTTGALADAVSYVVDCTISEFKKPTDLAVSEIGPHGAVLSWTENGEATAWVVEVTNNADNVTATFDAPEIPYTLTGLVPNTEYFVRVRPAGENDKWSDGITFSTFLSSPTAITASNITETSAVISWTGNDDAESYNLRYKETTPPATIILEAGDIWGDGSGYQMLLDADATAYGTVFTSTGGWTATDYNDFEYLIPTNADCSADATNFVLNNSVSIQIPAGTYDWCILNPSPDYGKIYIAASNGNVGGRADDYVFEAGKTYTFVPAIFGSNDGIDVTITGEVASPVTSEWTTVENVTSPYTIEGLEEDTYYEAEVQSVYADGESGWEGTYFSTLSSNPVPTNLVADVQADGVTLTWDGSGESYNVQYRTAADEEMPFFEDFENGLPDNWSTIDADGDGNNWIAVSELGTVYPYYAGNDLSDYVYNGNDAVISASAYNNEDGNSYTALDSDNWLISPLLDLEGTLKFYVKALGGYGDEFEVLLSTNGTEAADFTTTLQEMTAATSGWTEVSIPLADYEGQQGYIAIHHVFSDGYFLIVDDFGLYEPIEAGEWQEIAVSEATVTLNDLDPNTTYEYQVQSVKGDETSDWSSVATFTTLEASVLELVDGKDNLETIEEYAQNGYIGDVKLTDRTLYKDGGWNTLVLPFAVEDIDATPLAGAIVKTLESASFDNGTLTLNFTDDSENLTTLDAGVPYIVKWEEIGDDIVDPVFSEAKISAVTENVETDVVSFIGTYNTIDFGTEVNTSVFLMGAGNTLFYPNGESNSYVNTCRAYFQLADGYELATEASVGQNAKVVRVDFNFGDGHGIATGIVSLDDMQNNAGVYTLSGVKLDKATKKGVYIQNGRKVVIGKNR